MWATDASLTPSFLGAEMMLRMIAGSAAVNAGWPAAKCWPNWITLIDVKILTIYLHFITERPVVVSSVRSQVMSVERTCQVWTGLMNVTWKRLRSSVRNGVSIREWEGKGVRSELSVVLRMRLVTRNVRQALIISSRSVRIAERNRIRMTSRNGIYSGKHRFSVLWRLASSSADEDQNHTLFHQRKVI